MKKLFLLIAILLAFVIFSTACVIFQDDGNADGETAIKGDDTEQDNPGEDDKEPEDDGKEDDKEDESEKHTHTFTDWSCVTLPSCLNEGVMTRTCACGDVESYTVAPLRHDMVDGSCTNCGRKYSEGLEFENTGLGVCALVGIGTCTDTDIVIPPTSPDGDSVTSVKRDAFSGNEDITRFDIPNTVTSILTDAFSCCKNLIAITVEDSNQYYYSLDGNLYVSIINYLEQYAIGKTNSEFVIPDGTVYIKPSAFVGAENLVSVTLPDSLKSFVNNDFSQCKNIKNIYVSENHPEFSSVDGILYSKDKKTLLSYGSAREAEEFIIPDHVEVLGAAAFANCNYLKKVKLNNEINVLNYQIFYDCKSLLEVNIPEGITEIPNHAFANCASLKNIIIPDSVETVGEYAFSGCSSLEELSLNKVKTVKRNAFALCYALSSIDFGSCLTELGDYSFTLCNGITSITLPDGLTLIGGSAFSSCEDLESAVLPDSVVTIKLYAFSSEKLNKIYYKGTSDQWDQVTKNSLPEYGSDLVIYFYSEEAPTEEGDFWRYYDGAPLSWAYTDPQLDNEFSFEPNDDGSCTLVGVVKINRSEVIIPSVSPDGKSVTVIGKNAFKEQTLIESIVIPDSVVTIERSAFGYLSNLKSLTIGNGVKTIGDFAFYNLGMLTSIVVPDSVESIGSYAFSGCDHLISIVFGNGITSIGEYVLYGNLRLTSVSIPAEVVSIEKNAFGYCSDLTDVYFGGTATEWAQITVAEGNDYLTNATIHTN